MNGMDRRLKRADKERREMFKAFFAREPPTDQGVLDYVKDRILKDMGVPWHQIGVEEARTWRKTHEPFVAEGWWTKPDEEEWKRMIKMMGGCVLRLHV